MFAPNPLKLVDCTVSSPTPLFPDAKAGIAVNTVHVDITFRGAAVAASWLVFQNFYTHTLDICHREKDAPSFETLYSTTLMADGAHCENQAQDWHRVYLPSIFKVAGHSKRGLYVLRLVCRQPSPLWASHGVKDVKLYVVNGKGLDAAGPQVPPPSRVDVLEAAAAVREAQARHRDAKEHHVAPLHELMLEGGVTEIVP